MPLFRINPDGTVDRLQVSLWGGLLPSSVGASEGPANGNAKGSRGGTGMVPCPWCGTRLKPAKLQGHQARRCPSRPDPGRQASTERRSPSERAGVAPKTATPTPPTLVLCPTCRAKVRSDQLDKHHRKAHAGRAPSAPTPSGSPSRKERSHDNETRRQTLDHERRLDGSRGIGHTFRDRGQFGSLPSFDRMDDESDP